MSSKRKALTPAYRKRLEELEKALLEFRRAVGTALISNEDQQHDLEVRIGMLQFRIKALADAGDISVTACRGHARHLIKLSERINRY